MTKRFSISISEGTFHRVEEYAAALLGSGTKGRRSMVIEELLNKGLRFVEEGGAKNEPEKQDQ